MWLRGEEVRDFYITNSQSSISHYFYVKVVDFSLWIIKNAYFTLSLVQQKYIIKSSLKAFLFNFLPTPFCFVLSEL